MKKHNNINIFYTGAFAFLSLSALSLSNCGKKSDSSSTSGEDRLGIVFPVELESQNKASMSVNPSEDFVSLRQLEINTLGSIKGMQASQDSFAGLGVLENSSKLLLPDAQLSVVEKALASHIRRVRDFNIKQEKAKLLQATGEDKVTYLKGEREYFQFEIDFLRRKKSIAAEEIENALNKLRAIHVALDNREDEITKLNSEILALGARHDSEITRISTSYDQQISEKKSQISNLMELGRHTQTDELVNEEVEKRFAADTGFWSNTKLFFGNIFGDASTKRKAEIRAEVIDEHLRGKIDLLGDGSSASRAQRIAAFEEDIVQLEANKKKEMESVQKLKNDETSSLRAELAQYELRKRDNKQRGVVHIKVPFIKLDGKFISEEDAKSEEAAINKRIAGLRKITELDTSKIEESLKGDFSKRLEDLSSFESEEKKIEKLLTDDAKRLESESKNALLCLTQAKGKDLNSLRGQIDSVPRILALSSDGKSILSLSLQSDIEAEKAKTESITHFSLLVVDSQGRVAYMQNKYSEKPTMETTMVKTIITEKVADGIPAESEEQKYKEISREEEVEMKFPRYTVATEVPMSKLNGPDTYDLVACSHTNTGTLSMNVERVTLQSNVKKEETNLSDSVEE